MGMPTGGKGDKRRPTMVEEQQATANFEAIFGKSRLDLAVEAQEREERKAKKK